VEQQAQLEEDEALARAIAASLQDSHKPKVNKVSTSGDAGH
jgi:hypothetical protein